MDLLIPDVPTRKQFEKELEDDEEEVNNEMKYMSVKNQEATKRGTKITDHLMKNATGGANSIKKTLTPANRPASKQTTGSKPVSVMSMISQLLIRNI